MTTETIKQEVIELISELFKDKGFDIDIIKYVDLIDDLGMDSITFISIVVEVEAHFCIEVPDDMLLLENFKCVDDIVSIIENEFLKKSEGAEVIENVETWRNVEIEEHFNTLIREELLEYDKFRKIKNIIRFYKPSAGEILLDGISIDKYAVDSYRNFFSTMFQNYIKIFVC